MPQIYDNIENYLKDGLRETVQESYRADFCVGYFNLRGWKHLMELVDQYDGTDENCCRLLVGMQRPAEDLIRDYHSFHKQELVDPGKASALKKKIAFDFRQQLTFGIPTNNDEYALKKLAKQLKEKKVRIKLYLSHALHAKLYLLHRKDSKTPKIGYLGSSNLTMSGLSHQGELNIDVVEQDAANKLIKWFEDRWNDSYCLDISEELIQIIEESWASEKILPPYYIYLKVAYHLSQEAQLGLNNYIIPKEMKNDLLPFQQNAVLIAARHLDKRGGVLIGDVVGLGKTLTATALAKVFEETFYLETLIICPKNLVEMWKDYIHKYRLAAEVVSLSSVNAKFIEKRRYRVVIIDESHNLRNRDGKRYAIVKDYLDKNESKVILITATPYNKMYQDIANQLRLFLPEDQDIGISPERFIDSVGGILEFEANYQYMPSTLLAFEKSHYSDDWRELLKLYMVRRTRFFIKENYAQYDKEQKQFYLTFQNGTKFYFPHRIPKKIEFKVNDKDKNDLYAQLYSNEIVNQINSLNLPRYGLGNFIDEFETGKANKDEAQILDNLSRAGKRLMGFCRTNLFKRLESSGYAFLLSVARHIMRNQVFIHALSNGLPLPIGQQESSFMDEFLEENDMDDMDTGITSIETNQFVYQQQAIKVYAHLEANEKKYDWIHAGFFQKRLIQLLQQDSDTLLKILEKGKVWDAKEDNKLYELERLCRKMHSKEKLLIFTQFADTAYYLFRELKRRGIEGIECVTGDVEEPSVYAKRFSPRSNHANNIADELRILITTDVLSEGQNLQDGHIIVNYDLPWALIRLIQRAGRVDRIGQENKEILCYSFLPAEGLEQIINLRRRLVQRISENAEVVGTDETFFDGDPINLKDLYNEKSGIFDDADETEVDLTSTAYEIWNQATKARPELKKLIPELPNVIFSTKALNENSIEGESVISYHKTAHDMDVLSWLDKRGRLISTSQSRILKALECEYNTLGLSRLEEHHQLVSKSVEISEREEKKSGGQLGKKSGARYKCFMQLKRYSLQHKNTLFDTPELDNTIQDLLDYPLRESAKDLLNKRLRIGITDDELAKLVIELRKEDRLSVIENKAKENYGPQIICSMGLRQTTTN